jgi:hypothetical protein
MLCPITAFTARSLKDRFCGFHLKNRETQGKSLLMNVIFFFVVGDTVVKFPEAVFLVMYDPSINEL